jgi:hypothetical protein
MHEQKFFASFFQERSLCSFLKKRTKKLLLLVLTVIRGVGGWHEAAGR